MLPDMVLLMHQRAADLLVALADEPIRIQCQLMPASLVQPAVESIRSEVAKGPRLTLVGDEDVRQLAVDFRTLCTIAVLLVDRTIE